MKILSHSIDSIVWCVRLLGFLVSLAVLCNLITNILCYATMYECIFSQICHQKHWQQRKRAKKVQHGMLLNEEVLEH